MLSTMLQLNAQRGNNTWGRFAPDGRLQVRNFKSELNVLTLPLKAAAVWFPPDRNLRPSLVQMAKSNSHCFNFDDGSLIVFLVGFENLRDLLKIGPKTALKVRALLEFMQKSIEAEFPDNCWILFYFAVSNEFHNKGIGRHLLSHVLTGNNIISTRHLLATVLIWR